MAAELSLDAKRLDMVFRGFPSLFRKTVPKDDQKTIYYALQARYAQREGPDTSDPTKLSGIDPLSRYDIEMLLNFVSQRAEREKASARAWVTVIAAIIAAASAVVTAWLK